MAPICLAMVFFEQTWPGAALLFALGGCPSGATGITALLQDPRGCESQSDTQGQGLEAQWTSMKYELSVLTISESSSWTAEMESSCW